MPQQALEVEGSGPPLGAMSPGCVGLNIDFLMKMAAKICLPKPEDGVEAH